MRLGNAAVDQLQLDIYGELMDSLHVARRHGISVDADTWSLQKNLLDFLERAWTQPDEGIWEVRGPRRHFTHSKVMTWVAFDRAIKAVERYHLDGPIDRWRRVREDIHDHVCREAIDPHRSCFTQYFGTTEVDASLLLLPLVGFVQATDPQMRATVAAIEQDLLFNGFVRRYRPKESVDGLPGGEGVFLACTFWLADNYCLQGRHDEAVRVFERLSGLCNDLGLLSEEYDVVGKRFLGNFPQAFSHVMLINSARNLSNGSGPAQQRHQR